tara:strand:+ start:190 stop:834 length:645 start_codon:yes stop_codon:yes gene_type:complete
MQMMIESEYDEELDEYNFAFFEGQFEVFHAKSMDHNYFFHKEQMKEKVFDVAEDFEVVFRVNFLNAFSFTSISHALFRWTNSVDEYWVERFQNDYPEMNRIIDNANVVGEKHRSTSVGDLICDVTNNTWYVCAPFGWKRLKVASGVFHEGEWLCNCIRCADEGEDNGDDYCFKIARHVDEEGNHFCECGSNSSGIVIVPIDQGRSYCVDCKGWV